MSNELTRNPGRFDEVIHIIDNARSRAMKAVNAELIQMYWEIGAYVSGRVKDGGWGKSVVADFSEFLQAHYPGTKGFSAQNIWRMKQFYETYCDNEKLPPPETGPAREKRICLPASDFLTICWTALRGTAFLTWNAR